MKAKTGLAIIAMILLACTSKPNKTDQESQSLMAGTWQLISGTTIQKKDTVVTDYLKDKKAIKIINGTHFSFLIHDLTKGKGTNPMFVAGGGRYTLEGNKYTEFLEYCNDRQWENNKFEFTVAVKNDTLTQTGLEKIDSIGVNRINIEKYIRIKKS